MMDDTKQFSDDSGQGRVSDESAAMPTVDQMVERFLSWRLPDPWYPDGGITFDQSRRWSHGPTGTNLFDANQARAMVLHMLGRDG